MTGLVEKLRAFDRWDGHCYKQGFGTTRLSPLPFEAADRITALEAENARLREALQAIELGTYPRPVGKAWFPDGRASKHDQCIHDVWMYEPCETCIDAFVSAALDTSGGA